MYYLTIDTSNNFSLALFKQHSLLHSYSITKADLLSLNLQVSDIVIDKLDNLLTTNNLKVTDLEFCAFIRGSGFFNGLRIGALIAKTWSAAINLPVVSFLSSELILHHIPKEDITPKSVIVATTDIGKSGAVITIFDNDFKMLQSDVYIPQEQLLNFFTMDFLLQKKLLIAGSKQDALQSIDFSNDCKYYDNIMYPSVGIFGEFALKAYVMGNLDEEILPLYAGNFSVKF